MIMSYLRQFQQRWPFQPGRLFQGRGLWFVWFTALGWAASCNPDEAHPPSFGSGSGGAFTETTDTLEVTTYIETSPTTSEPFEPGAPSCAALPQDLILDPPCSDDDLIVAGGCSNFYDSRDFLLPLSPIPVPSPPDLRAVLLPLPGEDNVGGQGGQGGQGGAHGASPPWLGLVVDVVPAGSADVTATGFQLLQPGASLSVSGAFTDPTLAPYVEYLYPSAFVGDPYIILHVAVVRGEGVLFRKRVILEPDYSCIVR